MMHHTLIYNVHGKYTRLENYQGRQYLVAPVVMLREGVHAGSNGALYYPESELAKDPAAWNMKPIVVYHPTGPDGLGISANTPGVLDRQGVGMIKNANWEGRKLRAQAWIDVERITAIAPELVDPLLNDGGKIEVSTGLYMDAEPVSGWYGGTDFQFTTKNYKPDHLALLPTGVGACAVADGCGIFQTNEENIMNNETLPMPLWDFGYREPVLNHGTGDRDDNLLPMPVMTFEAPTANGHGGTPCGCGGEQTRAQATYNTHMADDDLPLPSTL